MTKPCTKIWYPKDVKSFSPTNPIRVHLNEGRQVAVGSNGWFIESWSPFTKELFSLGGDKIGTREEPPKVPSTTEFRKTGYITVDQDNQDKIPDSAWSANNIVPGWFADRFEGMPDAQITFDSTGEIIDIWIPSWGIVTGIDGLEVAKRTTPFGEHKVLSEVKNPLRLTYRPADKDTFPEGSDAWHALTISPDMEMTLDDKGFIIDIWDSKTGKQYDIHGREIGTRTDPYPSDNNMGDCQLEIAKINDQIRVLRAQRSALPRAARAALTAMIAALCAKRGHIVFRWGRLLGRKRRMDVAYHKRMIKSTTKQK